MLSSESSHSSAALHSHSIHVFHSCPFFPGQAGLHLWYYLVTCRETHAHLGNQKPWMNSLGTEIQFIPVLSTRSRHNLVLYKGLGDVLLQLISLSFISRLDENLEVADHQPSPCTQFLPGSFMERLWEEANKWFKSKSFTPTAQFQLFQHYTRLVHGRQRPCPINPLKVHWSQLDVS